MQQVNLKEGSSADIIENNINHLKKLFPDAFTEDSIDFNTLRQLLGDLKILDENEEKYGLKLKKKDKDQLAEEDNLIDLYRGALGV